MFGANRYYLLGNPWSNDILCCLWYKSEGFHKQCYLWWCLQILIATTNHFNLFYRSYLFQIIRFKKVSFLSVNTGKELFLKLLVSNHTKSKLHSLFQKYTSGWKVHIQKTLIIKVYLYYKKKLLWVWKIKSFSRVTLWFW